MVNKMEFLSKKIFITGGTGFIGCALTTELIKHGAEIYILTRDTTKKNKSNVNYIFSITDIVHIQPDIIINLAGEPISKRWTHKTKNNILLSRLQITTQIADYIESAQKKPKVFISGSAIGYYGTDPSCEFFEETIQNIRSNSFAAEVCLAWENAARATSENVRLVLLRTGVVLEKNGGMLSKLIPIFRLGLGGAFGSGKQYISWIELDDLIRVILFCIQNENISGPVNATAPQPVTNLQFAKELALALHRSAIFRVPALLISIMSGQMGEELILNGQYVLPKKLMQYNFTFNYPTLNSAFYKIFNSK